MEFSKIEEEILNFWEKEKIFQKTLENRKDNPLFSFYDGPPFATGMPHYGHVLASTIKDSVLRYKTMRGYRVPRRVGWDCHGLPVENLIEKEMDVDSKREIEEKIGIEKFNQTCQSSVFRCVDEWKKTLSRVGRWADYENDYTTMDTEYIESVWWVFKKLWDQGLIYRDYKISPYCPRCGTPVSNFEVNQGYKLTVDPSIFIKMKIKEGEFQGASFLVWTTTPWTLPGNVALAVNPNFDYVLAHLNNEDFILAKDRLEFLEEEVEIKEEFKGKKLEGIKYESLYPYLKEIKPEGFENAFKVYLADFVTLDEGTGVVHTAVMYGEDDFELGKKENLPFLHLVNEEGKFIKEAGKWAGLFVKKADPKIIEDLEKRNLLYKKEDYEHSYPFCWRCDTPLLYYAFDSWYVKVTAFKKKLLENNEKIHWVPEHLKEGRFGKWLEGARDWSISRNRFWGAPIPVWECDKCGKMKAIGSMEELSKNPKNLHRPYIDKVTFNCECGGKMQRVEEVFDCWFESGSMPYAQMHYPFENKKETEKAFPADFIAEGVDQTRGWFYTLHVLATALTLKDVGLGQGQPAFKNVITNGLILDETGKKLSKKLRNYPEMDHIFDTYGADSLRFFLLSSTKIGEDYRFSEERVKEIHRRVFLTLWHSYSFFNTYVEKVKFNAKPTPIHCLNKWILSKVNRVTKEIINDMEDYQLTDASRKVSDLIDDLSNWYIRRSRRKLQKPKDKKEKQEFVETFYYALIRIIKLMAPYAPFLSDYLYRDLTKDKSVHLADYPEVEENYFDDKIEKEMVKAREIATEALSKRAKAGIKVRQPLAKLKIKDKLSKEIIEILKEEINVKNVVIGEKLELDTNLTFELKKEGAAREIIRKIQSLRKKAGFVPEDKIKVYYAGNLEKITGDFISYIQQETLATDLIKKDYLADSKNKVKFEREEISLKIEKIN